MNAVLPSSNELLAFARARAGELAAAPPGALRMTRALLRGDASALRARIAESTHEGLRLLIMGEPGPPSERLAREADLRATALGVLRGAGVR